MSWRVLLILPITALLLGETARVPRLRAPIPVSAGTGCDYQWARRSYLLAFAYTVQKPSAARRLARGAAAELTACQGDVTVLRERLRDFTDSSSP